MLFYDLIIYIFQGQTYVKYNACSTIKELFFYEVIHDR